MNDNELVILRPGRTPELINVIDFTDKYVATIWVDNSLGEIVDVQASFDFWIAWSPKVGDVAGDNSMEILVATGSQAEEVGDAHDGDYPRLVYDKNFN